MCGRYALFAPAAAIRRAFGLTATPVLGARYNIAPAQEIAAVRAGEDGSVRLDMLRWGLVPSWAEDLAIGRRLINARVETLASRPAFRSAFRRRRCLIPASGFYEWKANPDEPKTPYFISARTEPVIAFAGLWEHHQDSEGLLHSCTVITTQALGVMRSLHDRMPLIMPPERRTAWLDPALQEPAAITALLAPDGPELQAWAVDPVVNSPRNEGPDLIRPRIED